MKKFLLSLVLMFFSISTLFAQRDTEHWIAPYFDVSGSSYNNRLYLSTDSTTPFDVTIYNNNVALGTVTISKGAPDTYLLPANTIVATAESDAYSVISKGVYLKGTKPFYCSLRSAISSHGEIVTSKGKAGIGTIFYAAATPISGSSYNFTTAVMATENNTKVTVSGYDPNIQFTNQTAPPLTTTFVLNKGQSFIFTGKGGTAPNNTGFIGSKIVSDKAITVTNGNSNGNFGTSANSGSDLILDQSVPTSRLGNTFAMVKTRATAPANNMEGAIVIATENNTDVYINGITTPIATLNEGDWYRINETNYVNQGSGHSNMFISTTKNVYIYQLVGVGPDDNTGGYNYIPPLNCFLPRKIDEIGKINEMPVTGPSTVYSGLIVKLNILTEAGATVSYTVNGGAPTTPTAAQGPFPLTGNTNWVTYAITGIAGNVSVTSNKAVTAGLNGGYSTAGYGGYFAGFSSIPLISKTTGDCIPGIILEVDDSYDSYQWFLNGNPITGANSNSYSPTVGGNYTVKVTIGSCPPETTPVFKVFTCLTNSTKALSVCDISQVVIPEFTVSTQTYNPSTVTIVTPPTNGIATINPVTGVINYTPNVNYVGTDTVVYKFCGNAPEFVDCEQVTLTFTVSELPVVTDATLRTCFLEANTATGQFDLTIAPVTGQGGVTKKYYPSTTDAVNGTNEILTPDNYIAPNGVAYVKVTNGNGCYRIAKVTLIVFPPTTSSVLTEKVICIEDKTTLDAGPNFDGYQWSTGATTQSISDVTVGTYWVRLKTGDCWTTQTVKVYPAQQPVISSVDIATTTVTAYATGGTAPYKYSMDNISWQDSNVFTNVPRGSGIVYVKDAYDCNPISVEITIPNIINVITPNNDGVNDVLDYSELGHKSNLVIDIFDRYGTIIYQANKANGYKWDGTTNGSKKVSTGSYWFSVSWNEPNAKQTPIKYSGWILVKNRE
jgi:gliding motility-associated-like protein